jgi:hypothetical protein
MEFPSRIDDVMEYLRERQKISLKIHAAPLHTEENDNEKSESNKGNADPQTAEGSEGRRGQTAEEVLMPGRGRSPWPLLDK